MPLDVSNLVAKGACDKLIQVYAAFRSFDYTFLMKRLAHTYIKCPTKRLVRCLPNLDAIGQVFIDSLLKGCL